MSNALVTVFINLCYC